ncbi:MAG: type II toxin-antitoxin system RelE/ParE family toxin, partial [Elusimicrobia bacterium]|nr:type II toxin-antitoxin system RelE/ParE family toxin [Elusimicrobiota bacterium]
MSSDKFRIVIDPAAARDLKRLHRAHRDVCRHIVSTIDSLESSPFCGKPLKGNKKGCHSLRYGDYRIIYEIYHHLKTIHVLRIGHR